MISSSNSSKEGTLQLIDSLNGIEKKKIFTRSHGIGIAKYTHHQSCVLLSSERKSHDIRYLCLHDNRYLRFFRGHTDKVTSISMSPVDDSFLTSSLDRTAFLWNLNSPHPAAKLQLPPEVHHPYICFDESGLIFGVMAGDIKSNRHSLKLYDARNFQNGPFQDIASSREQLEHACEKLTMSAAQTQRVLGSKWTNFQFSPDGLKILVNTNSDSLFVFDGFDPFVEPVVISSRKNEAGLILGSCFSSDGNYVIGSNDEYDIQIYDRKSATIKTTLSGHVAPVLSVKCNPKYDVLASACLNTVLWLRQ